MGRGGISLYSAGGLDEVAIDVDLRAHVRAFELHHYLLASVLNRAAERGAVPTDVAAQLALATT